MKKILILGALIVSSQAFAGGCPVGLEGEMKIPAIEESRGTLHIDVKEVDDLGEEVINADGWSFRARTITFGPGAVAALHSHDARPEMAMMQYGEVTIYETTCKVPYKMTPGVVYNSGRGDMHWARNETDDYAVMYVVDIYKADADSFPTK